MYLEQASEQVYKKTFLWQKIDLGVKTPQSIRREILTPLRILHLQVFCKPISVDSLVCLPGDEYTRESRLQGGEYTGELITITNNSSNIRKNSKSFLGMSNGTWR
jgi:hypothetical protein